MLRITRLSLVALLAVACGRSSLLGGSPTDCPPQFLQPDGTCTKPLPDMKGTGDMADAGGDMLGCPDFCGEFCGDPSCCACAFCQFDPICQIDMRGDGGGDMRGDGGDMRGDMRGDMSGDMADFCGDPSHCMLPACLGDPRCHVLGHEVCNNGIDDNNDGLVDCMDPECKNLPLCQPHMCDPNNPNCTDPACVMNPKCQDLACHPTIDWGTINPMGSTSTRMFTTKGTTDVTVTPCAPGDAGMVVGEFTTSGTSDVLLTFSQGNGEDHVFGLFRAGINQGCGANPIECFDPKGATSGTHTYPALAAGHYYLISQPFEAAGQGPVTVTLSTETKTEICNNGIDDNGNGLIDCADHDCLNAPNCVNQQCMPDFNVGALVVNDPGKTVSFNTTTADANNELSCEAAKGGKDVVVKFTLQETAGILLQWDQSGDHVVGLMKLPPPGQGCDADQLSCYDPSGRTADTVAWTEQPPGDYLFIFKALKPGDEGHIDATISAFRNRRVELCHNGIDDDGNGLVDCADPACAGVAGCSAPFCMPDVQFGQMNVGDSMTTNLNINADGHTGLKATCAKGGGKAMVVQLTVPTAGPTGGVGIGFDCTMTGDQVLDLYAAGGPRDPCDATELVCADPQTLPFGCGYEVPNLQPGTYNVIVEGFEPGTEGTVNLTLSVTDDRQLEICNNGIDDDHDGFTDCLDRKCVTSQFCAKAQCRPDDTIDPMPLDGSQVFELVRTSGNGVHAATSCAAMPGGETAVILVRLTAAADLNVTWQQIGNHVLAVYTDDGALLPCDGGTQLFCTPAVGNNMNGSTKFTNVPEGKYYVVIAANTPTSAGSVSIAISGTPH